jgi:hypothetical protein
VECKSLFSFHLFGMCLRYLREAAEKRVAFLLLFLGVGLVQPCGGASIGFENTGSVVTRRSELHQPWLLDVLRPRLPNFHEIGSQG